MLRTYYYVQRTYCSVIHTDLVPAHTVQSGGDGCDSKDHTDTSFRYMYLLSVMKATNEKLGGGGCKNVTSTASQIPDFWGLMEGFPEGVFELRLEE